MPVELSFSNDAAILTIDNSPLNLINAEVRAGIQSPRNWGYQADYHRHRNDLRRGRGCEGIR